MNDVLKQRLVGALILVALGVVFWPIIFVEPGEQGDISEIPLPARPDVDTTPVPAPDLAGIRTAPDVQRPPEPAPEQASEVVGTGGAEEEPEDVARALPQPDPVLEQRQPAVSPPADPGPTRSEPPVTPRLDDDGIPIAWILRVASLSSKDKAEALRASLVEAGHTAHVKRVNSQDRYLYRVYVGPKIEKKALEAIQAQVDRQFGVSTMITRYYP